MAQEVITQEELDKLKALNMKKALGGLDSDEEEKALQDLRRRKQIQETLNK